MVFDTDSLKKLLDARQVKDPEELKALQICDPKVVAALYEGEMTEHLGYEKQQPGRKH